MDYYVEVPIEIACCICRHGQYWYPSRIMIVRDQNNRSWRLDFCKYCRNTERMPIPLSEIL